MTFSDGLAVAAIALALSTIFLGVLFYRWQTEQGREITKSVNDFAKEMHGLVGELRGMTERMVEAQERQFNRMLDAFVTKPGAAAEVAERTGESAESLQQISEEMAALKEQLRHAASADDVQSKLDDLARRLEAVSESTTHAARLAEGAAAERKPSRRFEPSRRRYGIMRVLPSGVPPGGQVTIKTLLEVPLRDVESVVCLVSSPSERTWSQWWRRSPSEERGNPTFLFPDEFAGASTDELGPYAVKVMAIGTDGSIGGYEGLGFHVVEAEEQSKA